MDLDQPFGRDYWFDRHGQPITYERYSELKYESGDYRRIGSDHVGDAWVSTVWLGFDHGYMPDRPPVIFETMVFGGHLDGEVWRYYTEAEARAGHVVVVEAVRVAGKKRHGQIKHERDERRREMKRRIKELEGR